MYQTEFVSFLIHFSLAWCLLLCWKLHPSTLYSLPLQPEHVWQARHHVSKHKRIFSCFERRRISPVRRSEAEAWINLIRCALLSNSSYAQNQSRSQRRRRRRRRQWAGSIMHEGVWAINSIQHRNHTHTTHENWQIGFISSSMILILYNR